MDKLRALAGVVVAGLCLAPRLWAGGSGLNVVIIVNTNSSNSVQLGNYYQEKRQVPPQNFLRTGWTGGNVVWTESDLENTLLNPLLAMLAARQLTNQIDYVVLSMDFPYRVTASTSEENSTTASLFYGFKADTNPACSIASNSASLYHASEGIFRSTPPINAASNSWLVTMITASNLDLAKQVVDQGVAADSTFPGQTVLLGKSLDTDRNVRFYEFDNTVFDTRLRGDYIVQRTNLYDPGPIVNMLGYANGSYSAGVAANAFVRGAMADNLTSFGGQIFQDTAGQTTLLAFLQAGAAGSYGTVTEGCNYLEKFPSTENYFYQARGFSLAESYYQSLANPYQGLVVAEPLAAPFALPAAGGWTSPPDEAVLQGTTNLALQFTAPDALHPVQQVDLFLDGARLQTITNISPNQGNQLTVILNGHSTTYTVPASATVASVASDLAASLNGLIYSDSTKVAAILHGDRLELQSVDGSKSGAQVTLAVSNGVAGPPVTTFITASRTNFLDTLAWGLRGYHISGIILPGASLQLAVTKTNGMTVNLSTNASGGMLMQLAQGLVNLINASPDLSGGDGLAAEDFQTDPSNGDVYFNLRARSIGQAAAQIQANLTASPGLVVDPIGNGTLTDNLSDLQPRNHIYISAGVTNLAFSFPLDTTTVADGWHELDAVGYEGSHVRTQARATRNIRVQNNGWSAALNVLVGGTNTAREATLQFSVVASTNNITRIELFGTGGSLGAATGVSAATFTVAGTNLDLGLHPFYALVTARGGRQYRTETLWFRVIGPEPPFALTAAVLPTTLTWPATAGRSYDILTTTNLTVPFEVRDTLIATNTAARWADTNTPGPQLFYEVRVTP